MKKAFLILEKTYLANNNTERKLDYGGKKASAICSQLARAKTELININKAL